MTTTHPIETGAPVEITIDQAEEFRGQVLGLPASTPAMAGILESIAAASPAELVELIGSTTGEQVVLAVHPRIREVQADNERLRRHLRALGDSLAGAADYREPDDLDEPATSDVLDDDQAELLDVLARRNFGLRNAMAALAAGARSASGFYGEPGNGTDAELVARCVGHHVDLAPNDQVLDRDAAELFADGLDLLDRFRAMVVRESQLHDAWFELHPAADDDLLDDAPWRTEMPAGLHHFAVLNRAIHKVNEGERAALVDDEQLAELRTRFGRP